ncbi:hypothetical protein N7450_010722 [Penicillium hetheringtonii]|uniref:Uncharacterized protein n=1 Tax=Penicillium hetheringtonii TaxID=911720 RepID=A0AAD6GKA9_9EURO|nr:hypothetical protein N7450_010722 [Penicillium hetheringtonii]
MARPKSTKVEKKPKKPQKRACITEGNQVEKDLVFLWMCFECSGGIQEGQSTIDYHALGKKLGITIYGARNRYYGVRSRILKLKAAITAAESPRDQGPEGKGAQKSAVATTDHDDSITKDENDDQMVDENYEDEAV